jgi:Alpha/beta hydrolase
VLAAAIFLSTSATIGPVAEAFVVPENSSSIVVSSTDFSGDPLFSPTDFSPTDFSPTDLSANTADLALSTVDPTTAVTVDPGTAVDQAASAVDTSASTIDLSSTDGPVAGSNLFLSIGAQSSGASSEVLAVNPSQLPSMVGIPLLEQLSLLPSDTVSNFVSDNPTVVQDLIASPPAVHDVSRWWSGLTDPAQDALLQSAPEVVGNLNGVPFAIRDVANRNYLGDSIGEVKDRISAGGGRSQLIDDRRQLHMLHQIAKALQSTSGGADRHLLSVDTTGDGTASIVIGDLSTADYVSYLIPGMFFTVDGQIVDWANSAQYFYDSEKTWLKKLKAAKPDAVNSSVAVVAWLGYQTPGIVNVASLEQARIGRDAIAGSLQGLQALRKVNEPFTSVIAHSYGSTAAMMALTDYNITVDALAVVGSAGSDAKTAADLNVRNNNVYAGEAAWDPVPNSAYFGSDPGSTQFGARVFGTGGGVDPITHHTLGGSSGHNEYFGVGTESMRNLALIGIDEGSFIMGSGDAVMAKSFSGVNGKS